MDTINTEEYLKEKYLSSGEKISIVLLEGDRELNTLHAALAPGDLQGMSIVKTNTVDSLYRIISEQKPDIAILHIVSSEIDWLSLIFGIKELGTGIKIIVYSAYLERKFILKIMRTGVSGYVANKGSSADLLQALDVVHKGGVYLCNEILADPEESQRIPAFVDIDISFLSERECDVIRMIGEGLSTKEIAFDLVISIKTVATYRKRIMEKLDIYSLAGLIKFAISAGFTSL